MTSENTIIDTAEGAEDSRLYEVSFHIVPTLDEAGVAETVASLKTLVEKNGGSVVGSETPVLMKLAYTIEKDIERKRHSFESAYFGWMFFEATPEGAHAVKEAIATNNAIVRSLFIKADKEALEFHKHPAHTTSPYEAPTRDEVAVEDVPQVEAQPMTVEAMDAEIAKLVVE